VKGLGSEFKTLSAPWAREVIPHHVRPWTRQIEREEGGLYGDSGIFLERNVCEHLVGNRRANPLNDTLEFSRPADQNFCRGRLAVGARHGC